MRASSEIHMSLYRHLGRLFYAISAVDGIVRSKEKHELQRIITSEWLGVDTYTDESNVDCAHYIGLTFDWLTETNASPEECFRMFTEFFRRHQELFPKPVKDLIWKTADRITVATGGRNKSELVTLDRLKNVLEQSAIPNH